MTSASLKLPLRCSVCKAPAGAEREGIITYLAAGCPVTPLGMAAELISQAIKHNELAKMQSWIAEGWNVNKLIRVDMEGIKGRVTPLCLALRLRRVEMGQVLLEAGADPRAGSWVKQDGARVWMCPMEEALLSGNASLLHLLILKGARVNKCCRGLFLPEEEGGSLVLGGVQQSYLHQAARRGQQSSLQTLLENGANVAAVNDIGQTPLHLACDYFHPGCIVTLLQWGAPVLDLAGDVQTPLELIGTTAEAMEDVEAGGESRELRELCMQLLCDAGYRVTRDSRWRDVVLRCSDNSANFSEEFRAWVHRVESRPQTLQQLSCARILQMLRDVGQCNPQSISGLTCLPTSVISYLCLSQYDKLK